MVISFFLFTFAPLERAKDCCCSSVVEHFLGKEEVTSSSLVNSSRIGRLPVGSRLFSSCRDGAAGGSCCASNRRHPSARGCGCFFRSRKSRMQYSESGYSLRRAGASGRGLRASVRRRLRPADTCGITPQPNPQPAAAPPQKKEELRQTAAHRIAGSASRRQITAARSPNCSGSRPTL